jgi:hypothetical protein
VPSYCGSSLLDPKGRGGSTGCDNAVALAAGGRGDEEEQEQARDRGGGWRASSHLTQIWVPRPQRM